MGQNQSLGLRLRKLIRLFHQTRLATSCLIAMDRARLCSFVNSRDRLGQILLDRFLISFFHGLFQSLEQVFVPRFIEAVLLIFDSGFSYTLFGRTMIGHSYSSLRFAFPGYCIIFGAISQGIEIASWNNSLRILSGGCHLPIGGFLKKTSDQSMGICGIITPKNNKRRRRG